MDLVDFLKQTREDVVSLNNFEEIHVVIGNSTCDLDSTVSAILHAFHLSKISDEGNRTIIPVLNIPREDYTLRTEVVSYLSSHRLEETLLTFRNDLDLETLASQKNLKLTLVDHNILNQKDSELFDSLVVEIIDHHENARKEDAEKEINIVIEPVGSCVTLVVGNILEESEDLIDERIAMLATGTILLDTVNLSPEAGRTTPKDIEVLDKLRKFCPNVVHQDIFDSLQRAKFDISGLSAMDVLRKDYKSVCGNDSTIGLSTVPCSIEQLLQKLESGDIFNEFCESRGLSALLLVAVYHAEDESLQRELGIFSFNADLRNKLETHLTSDSAGLLLESQRHDCIGLSSFHQGNVNASRKVILPLTKNFLTEQSEEKTDLKENLKDDDEEVVLEGEDESGATEIKKSEETDQAGNLESEADVTPVDAPPENTMKELDSDTKDVSGGDVRDKERGEAEGAEEEDADSISITISRKDPPITPPEVVSPVAEADSSRDRLDTMLSDGSLGEITLDDDDDDYEDEGFDPESKGAYSGAADSPGRKRLSVGLGLDSTSVTTEVLDAEYPAVLTPSSNEMSWDDDASVDKKNTRVEPIPEYTAKEEHDDRWRWRKVKVGDTEHTLDNKVIEPFKKVLSHGGYYGDSMNAIIVVASCYLPEKSRKDYHYVMQNLFLYVVSSLELLVAQDYMIVYFHGAAPRDKIPSLGWMKRCYQMIDRRLRKNLKGLYIVHPTAWLKTVITFTRPFISAKFYRKLKFVYHLDELKTHLSMEYIYVPDEVKRFDKDKKDKGVRPTSGWLENNEKPISSISSGYPSPPYNSHSRHRRRNPYPEADQSFMPPDDNLSDIGTEGPESGRSSPGFSFSGSLGFFEDDFLAYAESHQPCSIEEYLMQQRELFEKLEKETEEEYRLEDAL